MQSFVREQLQKAIQAQEGEHTAEDVLRTFAQEATLMFKSDEVIRMLQSDPYEHLGGIKSSTQRLCQLLRVTEFEKELTKNGYCRIAATVQMKADTKMSKVGVSKYVELCFEYERDGTQNPGDQASVWYSIDVSRDDGPREKMLWVKVFCAGSVPSTLPAKNLEEGDDEEGGWEDIDDDDDDDNESTEQAESKLKKARIEEGESDEDEKMKEAKDSDDKDADGDGGEVPLEDRFTAGMDPDALEQFMHWVRLGKMDDATVFFLLMTFPFYEMEFDLTGFVLDAVFGPDDDEEEAADDEKQQ